jgi:MFS family permease
MYLDAPIVFGALKKWPSLGRIAIPVGLAIMSISLALSSFSTKVWHLIITQGILYAIGGSMAYAPTILYMDEWFVARKGTAFGVMWAGTGLAGVVFPLVIQWLLDAYGFRTALRIWSVALIILTLPLVRFLKPRLPYAQRTSWGAVFDVRFLKSPAFLILQVCNIMEALGYFLPSIYLPTYARNSLHSSSVAAAFTIIAINLSSVFGCILMGVLIDRYHVTTCILVSTIGTSIGVFLLWGLSSSLPLVYIFCITYGLFAGSFTTTWSGVIRNIRSKVESADTAMVFAFLAFGRGIGSICSGPLSQWLISDSAWLGSNDLAYGSGYGPLITFTGISALVGGCSFIFRKSGYL